MENESVLLERQGQAIRLMGVKDPSFYGDDSYGESVMESLLSPLMTGEEVYTVLLSHRPELFDVYVSCGVDLVLAVAPGQGLFPQYDAGIYTADHTSMVVSRGLGNSAFPFRINNRPEVVLVTLEPL